MKVTVARIYRFRGIHSLPDFPEPWCFPHQHDYTVEVVARDVDTLELDRQWAELKLYDDVDVDAIASPSTVENISSHFFGYFSGNKVEAVTVWEDRQRWGRTER